MITNQHHRRIAGIIWPIVSLVVLTLAIVTVFKQVRTISVSSILTAVHAVSASQIFSAIGITIAAYLLLTFYDVIGLRYIRFPQNYLKTAIASFIGYTFNNNIGLSVIAGSSVKFRFYSSWGISAKQIAKVIGLYTISFWVGLTLLGCIFLIYEPGLPASVTGVSPIAFRTLGCTVLAVIIGYFSLLAFYKKPVRFKKWQVTLPGTRLSASLVLIAMLDYVLSGIVLFTFLPAGCGIGITAFLGMYLLAQCAGMVSQLPGGIGVFESVMILLCGPHIASAQMVGCLLLFRTIFYIIPFLCAIILLAVSEVSLAKSGKSSATKSVAGVSTIPFNPDPT